METTEQPISQPVCFKCDDIGYTSGNEVFNVARCDCPIGAKADMRAPGKTPLLERVYDLIDEARDAGQVLTIDLVPLKPLAMGHYEMVADLRPKRERAQPVNVTGRGILAQLERDISRIDRPIKTMMHPERRTEARKVIWPVPDPKNFTLERRDAFSTLTDEQFDKRQSDRRKREAK